jgi:hypothetical protein
VNVAAPVVNASPVNITAPEAQTTTGAVGPAPVINAVPPVVNNIIPQGTVDTDRAGVENIIPASVQSPVTPIMGEALTPPVTPMTREESAAAEQYIYSQSENTERVMVEISPDEGLKGRVVQQPKSPNLTLAISGAV